MAVTVHENIWIPLSDGCRLSARLWIPDDAEAAPVPCVLEYIPYRKRDGTRTRDEPMHGFFAENGYAALRVDMRGSGESDGTMDDEYLLREQDDALEVIEWIATQVWCTGAVGMMGKSWGGFNCLQVAARRPPALKAVIPVCFTDNRFTDDVHFMGGTLLHDNLWWGTIMMAFQARAIDPEIVGEGWRRQWLDRLAALPFFPALWLEHQRYDAYWQHGSICQDYAPVSCPVLAVGGWADSYTDAVFRVVEHLDVPVRAIVGPWAHVYPHDGTPTPAIGFLQEAVRWWDHWLKGIDTGIMAEPMLRAYVPDPLPPASTRGHAPGRWVCEQSWPSPDVETRTYHLTGANGLSGEPGPARTMPVRSPLSTGVAGGEWMGAGCAGEAASDQRPDDAGSLIFETPVLDADFDVLGVPSVTLRLSSDTPVTQVSVRLCDVRPDLAVARVSYQVFNLTHRAGHETPEPLEPGKTYDVPIDLHACAHRFKTGHRIRISIATGYWPMVWPAPQAATLSIMAGESSLSLPVRTRLAESDETQFAEPARAAAAPVTLVAPGTLSRTVARDQISGVTTYTVAGGGGVFGEGVYRLDAIDTLVDHALTSIMTIADDDPLSAETTIMQRLTFGREGWMTRIETETAMSGDQGNFYLTGRLCAYENDALVFEKEWNESIARDLM